jgi:Transcriptional antiterminator
MKIAKIMNNNVVSALDEGNREIIVLGKEIGFQKHNGDLIDEVKVEKIFRLSEPARSKFEKLVEEIPYEYVSYTDEIVREATETLGMELNKNIYITLTDHLHFAIERYRRNITFQNALLWEIKRFYSREYEVGLKAVELLKEREGVALSVDEAAFIALHIVNAEMDINLSRTLSVPGMIKDLLNIVRYTFHVDLDEEGLSYERFVTHLKFFIQRTLKRQCYPTEELELYELYRKKAPKSYECAKKIKKYMEEKTDTEVTDEEMMYLTVHISRVIKETGAEAGAEA